MSASPHCFRPFCAASRLAHLLSSAPTIWRLLTPQMADWGGSARCKIGSIPHPLDKGHCWSWSRLFVYLLLQGRRLGPALPGPTASRPRAAAEYVTALAGLQRRLRQPRVVADHHRQRLKSAAGRLAQLPADLPDAEWLAQLQRAQVLSPTLLTEITGLLSGYAKINPKAGDEAELIRLVQATDALLASLPRANMQLVR